MKRALVILLWATTGMALAYDQPKVYDLKPNERVVILGDSTTCYQAN